MYWKTKIVIICDLHYWDICFNLVIWNWTHTISEVWLLIQTVSLHIIIIYYYIYYYIVYIQCVYRLYIVITSPALERLPTKSTPFLVLLCTQTSEWLGHFSKDLKRLCCGGNTSQSCWEPTAPENWCIQIVDRLLTSLPLALDWMCKSDG